MGKTAGHKQEYSKFNEATRVQMPALVHLTRIGYQYFGKISGDMAGTVYDGDTNILTEVFKEQFEVLNPLAAGKAEEVLRSVRQELDYDDLGRSFYKRLTMVSPIRLIDFEHPQNNVYHCTAEFTCRCGQEEFRPDITLFVNGLPLVFVEVKRPNNPGGMVAESERMNSLRFPNRKFRRFINLTQLMIFSNNMEYDAMGGIVPVQGSFYCTGARSFASFNCFREENPEGASTAPYIETYPYRPIDEQLEYRILKDFNNTILHTAPDYQTNLRVNTPANRILTSMCSPERLLFLLLYGIAYVKTEREVEGRIESADAKHIMRYQQMFAALAVRRKLKAGVTSGIIWHTQGSGKTALSYYLHGVLSDAYGKQNRVAKFYFIVDRLDLMEQAAQEFEARGLVVNIPDSRGELMEQFRVGQAREGNTGNREITVINIQRFEEEREKVEVPAYATNLQRIFIIDEAHRGYRPEGSFLANLLDADKHSIKIALTGTPLLKEERASWKVFGEYLHTYYYDKSVQDGYTLKIIREDIETSYREKLYDIYERLETLVRKKDIRKQDIIEHDSYVKELLRYIITDLKQFRQIQGDDTLGGMVICETSEQARKLYGFFDGVQAQLNRDASWPSHLKAGLILCDSDDKDTRRRIIRDFKKSRGVDLLVVFNMLLTGFDAPRLKRLYFGRKLKDHTLLQAITRVNRPYGNNRYGFVIDFADIKQNFDATNEAYLRELTRFQSPDSSGQDHRKDAFEQILEDRETLIAQMREVRHTLFAFTTDNLEEFSAQITVIEEKQEILKVKKALVSARDCCNLVRTFGDEALKAAFARLTFPRLPEMLSEVQRRIDSINQKEMFSQEDATRRLIYEAMQDITFSFRKIGEEEMKLISGGVELQEKWRKTVRMFTENEDQDDPVYITLREAFMEYFQSHGFILQNIEEYYEHSRALDEILKKLDDLQKKNRALMKKYNGDVKFARVHKRIHEENEARRRQGIRPIVSVYDETLMDALLSIKEEIDQKVYDRNDILKKDAYFEQTVMWLISENLKKLLLDSSREDRLFIQVRIVKQYLDQWNGYAHRV